MLAVLLPPGGFSVFFCMHTSVFLRVPAVVPISAFGRMRFVIILLQFLLGAYPMTSGWICWLIMESRSSVVRPVDALA